MSHAVALADKGSPLVQYYKEPKPTALMPFLWGFGSAQFSQQTLAELTQPLSSSKVEQSGKGKNHKTGKYWFSVYVNMHATLRLPQSSLNLMPLHEKRNSEKKVAVGKWMAISRSPIVQGQRTLDIPSVWSIWAIGVEGLGLRCPKAVPQNGTGFDVGPVRLRAAY
ncbi:4-hydroxythreonine-4-phosphate dehydrogenase [Anopheles sinensis]|uniref:4-hydroxythreonine-4-phosphate dehydrogenase n=1 Tax=Anopheles sinensis TaxID=74873 RepID=A0A084VSL8_ANOSI|nr:4-hydroxythreonine-4-phosphate dehydrogenase [Anopheles sinensis]